MARVIDADEIFHGNRKYPWEQLLDGQAWMLESPEDFTISPTSFTSAVHAAAAKRGMTVRTCKGDNWVKFQACRENSKS